MLGQLGHGVFIGLQPPQHFEAVLGQLGQTCSPRASTSQTGKRRAWFIPVAHPFQSERMRASLDV
jgi:hypothetical protein